jgi:chaperone modulatory protein CbpM
MTKERDESVLAGIVIDERSEVTLDQLSFFCAVRREQIVELVDEGVLEPLGGTASQLRFAGNSLRRAAKAIRLQQDLELDLTALALVLDLLERIESLRAQLPPDRGN